MQVSRIFDTIRDYAGASRKLDSELTFIKEEIDKINATDPATLDAETKTLNAKIEERASTVFTIADNVFQARRSALQRSLDALAYAMGPGDIHVVDLDAAAGDSGDDPERLAKIDVAIMLGISEVEVNADSNAEADADAEADAA